MEQALFHTFIAKFYRIVIKQRRTKIVLFLEFKIFQIDYKNTCEEFRMLIIIYRINYANRSSPYLDGLEHFI